MDARGFHLYGYMDRRGKAGGKPEDLTIVNFEPPREIARQWGIMPMRQIQICQESFDMANEWCPNPIEMEYEDWQTIPPLCTVHKAPPEPPEPPEPKLSCYEKYIKGRPMRKWQVGEFLKCLFGG
jgi:hypothetical protein